MDTERAKRKQTVRVLLTEAVMVVAVVVIVALLMFMVMGYSLKTGGDEWGVEQSGLVQLVSTPSGASIEVDGEAIFQRTETSRMMSEGEHEIKLYRNGYDSWSKKILVRPGIFLRIKYPRLFKDGREAKEAAVYNDVAWVDFAENRNSLLYAKKDSTVWHWVSLRNDTLTETEIDIAGIFSGEVTAKEWVGNGEKLLMQVREGEEVKWILLDLKQPARSVNLTEVFGMNFSLVRPMNDAADRMWAVENGNLRSLSLSGKEASGVLVGNVITFANNGDKLAYIARLETGQRRIGTYQSGDNAPVQVRTIDDETVAMEVALEEYLGDFYLSYMVGQKLWVYKADDFPKEEQKFAMEKVIEQELEIIPETFKASNNGQFVVATARAKVALMDAETEQVYQYTLENEQYFWLDDFLIGTVVEGELVVRDFDGTNRRVLTKTSGGDYPAIITVNGKWLYYFRNSETEVDLYREEL